MRILQVYPYFYPAWRYGGATRVVYEISKHLAKRGHKVTVYTTDALDEKSRIEINSHPQYIDGVKTYYFKNLSNYLACKHILALPIGLLSKIKEEIKEFDIIHLHGGRTFLNIVVHHYAKKYGIPYVLQAHGSLPRIIEKQGLKRSYDWVWGDKILNDASKIIAVSEEEANFARQMGVDGEKVSVIYNGMDVNSFRNLPKYGEFREKYGINERMILYLGRIHKSKGIDFAITSFAKFSKEKNDVTFVIAGADDGYKGEIENLVRQLNLSNKIKFTGAVSEEDKLSAYVDADLFIHTVRYMGGVGIAPLEAILCDTPVIVTDECGEIIKKAYCGYVVTYGDVDGLKEKMKHVLENPEEAKEMVERGKKYIMENLTWDKVVKKVEEVYESCIYHF